MQNAQEVFNRIEKTKKEIKSIKKFLTEEYEQIPEYTKLSLEKIDLNNKIKQIKLNVDNKFYDEVTKLGDLKIDLKSDKELLADIILSKMFKGEEVELQNQYKQGVLPIFKVIFKKN